MLGWVIASNHSRYIAAEKGSLSVLVLVLPHSIIVVGVDRAASGSHQHSSAGEYR